MFLRLSLVLEAHGALVHFIRLHSKFATKAFGIICRFKMSIMKTWPNTDMFVRPGKCEQTFLRLMLFRFPLVIKANGALVHTIRLNAVTSAEPSGVI